MGFNLARLIGEDCFEVTLSSFFQGLVKVDERYHPNHPDFMVNSLDLHFGLEAKCGHYGFNIKRYQVEGFEELDFPIFYIFGHHNLTGIRKSTHKMGRKRVKAFLDKNIIFKDLYLVDARAVHNFFQKEHKVNVKGTQEYCIMKRGHIKSMVADSQIKRRENTYSARDYYGLLDSNWRFEKCDLQDTLTFDTFTTIYSSEHRECVDFLRNQLKV